MIGENCLSYRSYDDLLAQIKRLYLVILKDSPKRYTALQAGGLAWVGQRTCVRLVEEVLNQLGMANS